MQKVRVFIDTNIILEAFRTGCWTAICSKFNIETVEKCIEESLTGDPDDPRRIHIDPAALTQGLAARHPVSKRVIAEFALKHPEFSGLDDGELHLLAWLASQDLIGHVVALISTADKAAIVATGKLGGLDSLTSLESLAQDAGVGKRQVDDLSGHYRTRWLDEIKVKVRFGIIP